VNSPSVVPTRPEGARLAVSGLSTGAYMVSPTAKIPKVVTNSVAASSGAGPATSDAPASTSHDRVQMAPTAMSRAGPLRRAVSLTTTICRAMMTTQFTAAARPMVVSRTSRTVSAYAGSPDSNWA
jgi:hypothetical protein